MIRKYKNRQLPRGILIDRDLVYVRIFKNGKQFKQSFGSCHEPANINIAISKLSQYRQEIQTQKFNLEQKAKRIHFGHAVDLYLTSESGQKHRDQLVFPRKFIGDDTWYDELSSTKMGKYRPWARENRKIKLYGKIQPIAHSTINRHISAIGSMYYWFKKQCESKEIEPLKLPEVSPCKGVEEFNELLSRRTRVLSKDELNKFLEIATPRVQLMVRGAIATALRKNDLLALNEGNRVDYADELHGEQSKTGRVFVVPMTNNVRNLFNEKGENILDDTNFRGEFEKSRRIFIEKTGAKHFQFRDLRRTALRAVWDYTKDIMLCHDLAGHSNVGTTQRYLGLTATDTHKAGDALNKLLTDSGLSAELSQGKNRIGFKPDENGSL